MQTTPAGGWCARAAWGRRGVPCGSATGHVAVRPANRVDHIGQRRMLQCNISRNFHEIFTI
ncbi:hypothetical protein DID96_02245 [Burkholderia sp. Bp8963]|nr:hypothetical protein DID96_02245 [Burkholderia sp. Bp8963]